MTERVVWRTMIPLAISPPSPLSGPGREPADCQECFFPATLINLFLSTNFAKAVVFELALASTFLI